MSLSDLIFVVLYLSFALLSAENEENQRIDLRHDSYQPRFDSSGVAGTQMNVSSEANEPRDLAQCTRAMEFLERTAKSNHRANGNHRVHR